MDHHFSVWQNKALALFAGRENYRSAGSRQTDTESGNIRAHMIHGVHDCHSGSYRSAGRIDIKINILFGVFGLKEKELSDDDVGRVIVNWPAQEYDTLPQKP